MGFSPILHDQQNLAGVSIFTNICINNGYSGGNPLYEEFALYVEDVEHVINRNPSVFALPAVDQGSGLPKVYSIDFGMLEETIILSGSIADGQGNPYLPTVHDITRIGRTWWQAFSLSGVDPNGFNRLLLHTEGSWNYDVGTVAAPGTLAGIAPILPSGVTSTTGLSTDFEVYGVVFSNVQVSRKAGQLEWAYKLTFDVVKFPEESEPGKPNLLLQWQRVTAE